MPTKNPTTTNKMKKFAIIVAGGTGQRMQSKLPKQFLPIHGKPILLHTIEAFKHAFSDITIVLVLHPDYLDYWKRLGISFDNLHITTGGESRFHSVKNGLTVIEKITGNNLGNGDSTIIGVHDAVRPILSKELLERVYAKAAISKAVIPVVPLKDSIRKIDHTGNSVAIDRADFRLVQTPQCFHASILQHAYQQEFSAHFTDSASVVEAMGQQISLVKGETSNIKITTPDDLVWAESFLNKASETL